MNREKKPPQQRTNKETAFSDKNSRIHSSRDFWEDIEPRANFNLNTLDMSNTQFINYDSEQERNPDLPKRLDMQVAKGQNMGQFLQSRAVKKMG